MLISDAKVVVVAITLIALALRLFRLGQWSFWGDETASVKQALAGIKALDEPHPLYIAILIPMFRFFGISEWSARLVPALVGSLSVPVLALAFQPFTGTPAALIFAILLAVSPWHIYWSQNARFYTITLLLQTLALLALFSGLETNSWFLLILYFVLYGLAVLGHETSILMLTVVVAYMVGVYVLPVGMPPGLTVWRALLVILLPAVFSVLIYLLSGGGFAVRIRYLRRQYAVQFIRPVANPFWILAGTLRYIGIPAICLSVTRMVFMLGFLDRFAVLMAAQALMPLMAVVAGSRFLFAANRYALLVLPGLLLLTAQAVIVAGSIRTWLGIVLLIVLIATALDDLYLYYFVQNGNRERWREVLADMGKQARPDDTILTSQAFMVQHYLDRPALWLDTQTRTTLEQLPGRAWFVLDNSFERLSADVRDWILTHSRIILSDRIQFHARIFTLTVRLYEPDGRPDTDSTDLAGRSR